jgi:hypothetical protein
MSLFSRFSAAFKRHSFIGSVVVYGFLYGGGDLTRQTIQRSPNVDLMNATRMATVGSLILAPAYYNWYKVLDRYLVGTSAQTIVKKVIIDQAIAGSCGIVLFYTGKLLQFLWLICYVLADWVSPFELINFEIFSLHQRSALGLRTSNCLNTSSKTYWCVC